MKELCKSLRSRGAIKTEKVEKLLELVDRANFISDKSVAYCDRPIEIGILF